jgi:hypothetical protein
MHSEQSLRRSRDLTLANSHSWCCGGTILARGRYPAMIMSVQSPGSGLVSNHFSYRHTNQPHHNAVLCLQLLI